MTVLTATEAGDVTVFGASDDLLEFRGAISEELDCWNAGVQRLTFSTGAVLEVEYGRTGGMWEIRVPAAGTGVWVKIAAERTDPNAVDDDEDGCPPYSDKATIEVPAGATVEVVRL